MPAKIPASGHGRNFHLREEPPHSDNPAVPSTGKGLRGPGTSFPGSCQCQLTALTAQMETLAKRHPKAGVHPLSSAFLLAAAPSKLGQERALFPAFNPSRDTASSSCRNQESPDRYNELFSP